MRDYGRRARVQVRRRSCGWDAVLPMRGGATSTRDRQVPPEEPPADTGDPGDGLAEAAEEEPAPWIET
jgi:hypothetical protein